MAEKSVFTERNKVQVIRTLNKLFEVEDYREWLFEPYIVYEMLRGAYSNYTTVYTMLTTLAAIVRDLGQTTAYKGYTNIIETLKPAYDKIRAEHKATPKQKANLVKWDDLAKVRDSYKNATLWSDYQKYIVLSLYTLIEPLRLDYANMRVFMNAKTPDDEINYMNITPTKIIINIAKHKTAKASGNLVIEIPAKEQLYKDINTFHTMKGIDLQEYLLYNIKGKPMDENQLSTYIRSIFLEKLGKAVSVNLIRHAYYEKYGLNNYSVADAERVGLSSHGLKTGMSYKLRGID